MFSFYEIFGIRTNPCKGFNAAFFKGYKKIRLKSQKKYKYFFNKNRGRNAV